MNYFGEFCEKLRELSGSIEAYNNPILEDYLNMSANLIEYLSDRSSSPPCVACEHFNCSIENLVCRNCVNGSNFRALYK